MSMDGATCPCLSLPFVSRPFHTRGPSWPLTAYNVTTAAFHQAISFQCHPRFCIHFPGLQVFHAAYLQSASYGTTLSRSVTFRNEFHVGIKKQETCMQRLNSYRYDESLDLETQILDFMSQSERPDLFPSRLELLRAGRSDLVEAILAKGGWMVAGWDLEPNIEEQAQWQDSLGINGIAKVQRENEAVGEFQKRQPTLLGFDARKAEGVGESSWSVWPFKHYKANQEVPRRRPNGINGTAAQAQLSGILDRRRRDLTCQSLAGGNKGLEVTSDVVEKKKKRRQKSSKMSSASSNVQQTNGQQACVTQSKSRHTKCDGRQRNKENNMPISHRIRGLEAELVSTLDILKSEKHVFPEKQKHSLHNAELEEVSDALEFCETEIMSKKRELRTARAQQTAFEGKLALDLMEFRRSMEEKDEQLERAMQVLKTLRTARIVWPNQGREVFLAGSYDGWASWKRMEKSSAGVFVTTLQLYPGQYEMKFIVDGAWTVDPNRSRTWENGYENNVLTIV